MTQRNIYQITALVILLPSVWLTFRALDLHYYTSMGPGPGFFPFWLALILSILAALMLVQATLSTSTEDRVTIAADNYPDAAGWLRLVAILAALGATAFLLERIGFGLTMFVMNVVVLWVLGTRSIVTILWVSILGSFGIEYAFTHWLNVPLPTADFSLLCPQRLCGE